MKDLRTLGRWRIGRKAKLKLEGAHAWADCFISDINLRGLRISLAPKLPKDTFLKFSLKLSKDIVLDLEAWVVWQKVIDGRRFYGLYFSKIKEEDKQKLYQFSRSAPADKLTQQPRESAIEGKGGENMSDIPSTDRRVFERFMAKFPVRFFQATSNQEGLAQAQDISAKGVGLVTKEKLPVNSPLEMWLDIPDKGDPLYARGQVVWSKPAGINEYWTGINLEKADLMGLSRILRIAQ